MQRQTLPTREADREEAAKFVARFNELRLQLFNELDKTLRKPASAPFLASQEVLEQIEHENLLARKLHKLLNSQISSLEEAAYLISHYEAVMALGANTAVNRALQANHSYIKHEKDKLAKILENLEKHPANRLKLLHNYLAMAEEANFARCVTSKRKLNGDFEEEGEFALLPKENTIPRYNKTLSAKRYHTRKIEEVIASLNPEDPFRNKIQQFNGIDTEPRVSPEVINNLKEKILNARKKRMELDCATCLANLPPRERKNLIKLLMVREILRNFLDALLYEEKKYFWELNVFSKLRYQADPAARNTYNFIETDTLEYKSNEFYNTDRGFGFCELLQNEQLQGLLLSVQLEAIQKDLEFNTIIETINDVITEHTVVNDPRLKYLRDEEKQGLWQVLVNYSKSTLKKDYQLKEEKSLEWIERFQAFAQENLLAPLNRVETLVDQLDADADFSSNDPIEAPLISLIKHANQIVAKVAPIETVWTNSNNIEQESVNKPAQNRSPMYFSAPPKSERRDLGSKEKEEKEKEKEKEKNNADSSEIDSDNSAMHNKQTNSGLTENERSKPPVQKPLWQRGALFKTIEVTNTNKPVYIEIGNDLEPTPSRSKWSWLAVPFIAIYKGIKWAWNALTCFSFNTETEKPHANPREKEQQGTPRSLRTNSEDTPPSSPRATVSKPVPILPGTPSKNGTFSGSIERPSLGSTPTDEGLRHRRTPGKGGGSYLG